MDRIDWLVLHHTVGIYGFDLRTRTFRDPVPTIRLHHRHRGFSDIGYHRVVGLDGHVYAGRPFDQIGAHTKHYNARSWATSVVGNYEDNAVPPDLFAAACDELAEQMRVARLKGSRPRVVGHRELRPTLCPGKYFDLDAVRDKVARLVGVPKAEIEPKKKKER